MCVCARARMCMYNNGNKQSWIRATHAKFPNGGGGGYGGGKGVPIAEHDNLMIYLSSALFHGFTPNVRYAPVLKTVHTKTNSTNFLIVLLWLWYVSHTYMMYICIFSMFWFHLHHKCRYAFMSKSHFIYLYFMCDVRCMCAFPDAHYGEYGDESVVMWCYKNMVNENHTLNGFPFSLVKIFGTSDEYLNNLISQHANFTTYSINFAVLEHC